jgi:hypothetical protein
LGTLVSACLQVHFVILLEDAAAQRLDPGMMKVGTQPIKAAPDSDSP